MKTSTRARVLWALASLAIVGLVLASGDSPLEAAEIFSPPPQLISPTGITGAPPAAARAAGWTIAAPESRMGLVERNPAFLAGTSPWALSVTGGWEHRDDWGSTYEGDLTRLQAMAAKLRIAPVSIGFAYQLPDRLDFDFFTVFKRVSSWSELETWTAALALEPIPTLSVGGSITLLDTDLGSADHTYRVSFGTELEVNSFTVAAAFQSEPFGAHSDRLLAPSWLQLDARMAIGERWAIAARLGAGWWNNTLDGRLRSPLDGGAGGSWRLLPRLTVLTGLHHVRQRYEFAGNVPASISNSPSIRRGQGTYVDAGLLFEFYRSTLALSVEDNHVDSEAPHTLLTLSAGVRF